MPYSKPLLFWKAEAAITELDSSSSKTSFPSLWNLRHGTASGRKPRSEIKLWKVLKVILNSQLNSLKVCIIVHPHMSTNWYSNTIRQKKDDLFRFILIMSLSSPTIQHEQHCKVSEHRTCFVAEEFGLIFKELPKGFFSCRNWPTFLIVKISDRAKIVLP